MEAPKVSENNASFMRSNLDKGLLMFCVGGLMFFTFHASHHDMDNNSGVTQFTMNLTGQAFAALLTLITVGSRKGAGIDSAPDVPSKIVETVHKTVETKTEIPPPLKEGD
jgi:hypothetical protein